MNNEHDVRTNVKVNVYKIAKPNVRYIAHLRKM
jgi:hypothetical protein